MALTVGELLAVIKVDKRGYDRGIDAAEARLLGFSRDTRGRLHDLQGRFVKEGEASGRGLAAGIAKGGERARRSLLPLAGLLLKGAGLLVFRAALAGAAVNALHFAGTLAPLLGLVAALPALLVAGAGALAALKVGLAGVGKAIKGDEDALAALAPSARQVVNEIRGLHDAWQRVRQTVQGAMFAPLRGEITALAKTWFPILRTELGGIGAEFGLMGQAAARAARDPGFVSQLGSALTWFRQLLAANRGAVGDLVLGFGGLVGAITPVLGLGSGFATMAARFREWVQSASESGRIAGFLTGGLAALKQLGALLTQVGGILGSVLGAAQQAGGGTLGVLTELLTTVNRFLSTGPGNDALVMIFTTLQQVVQALMPAVQVLAGALVSALAPLLPALVPLAGVVAQVVTALAPLLPVVGQLAGLVAGLLVQALGNLLAVLAPVIAAIAGALAPVLPLIAAALGQVLAAVAPLAQAIGVFLADAIAQLLPVILQMIPMLITGLVPAFQQLVPVLMLLLDQVRPLLPLWAQMLGALIPLIPAITKLVVQIVAALVPALTKVIPILAQVALRALPITIKAVQLLVTVLVTVIGWIGKVVGWFGKMLSAAVDLGRRAGEAFVDLKNKIVGALSGAGDWLRDAGTKIIDGLIGGIKAGFDKVKSTLGELTGMLPDWKGPRERDRRLLQPAGRLIMGGLIRGLRREFPAVRRLLGGLTGELGGINPAGSAAAAWGPAPVSHSVTYATTINPQRAEFTPADLAQLYHTLAVRARARRAW